MTVITDLPLNLVDMVRGNNHAEFVRYKLGRFLYKHTKTGIMFEIPAEDIGDATLHTVERAILLMRWLRPAVEDINAKYNT